jgi:hypothetical protein
MHALNKKGEIATNKVIITILVIVVIVAVFIFLFRAQIVSILESYIPNYSVPEKDEEINISDLPDDIIASLCPVVVGKVKAEEKRILIVSLKDDYVYFCDNLIDGKKKVCTLVRSNIKWNGDSTNAIIEVDQAVDDTIGSVTNRKVNIYPEIIEKRGKIYDKVKNDLPDERYLRNLNGSYYVSGNFICRTETLK